MPLHDIQLSPQLLTDLFKTLLVVQEPGNSPSINDSILKKNKSLGENKKHITILVNYSDVAFLPDEQLGFLTNMLGACKLNLGDVAILNCNNATELNYSDIISEFKSKTILLFDVSPSVLQLPILFPHFQIQKHKETAYLFSPSLQELQLDKLLKMNLWSCLKIIFNI